MKGCWLRPCGPLECETGRQNSWRNAATSRPNKTGTPKCHTMAKYWHSSGSPARASAVNYKPPNGRASVNRSAVIVTDNNGDNKLRVHAHTLSSESTNKNKNPRQIFVCAKDRETNTVEQKDDWINHSKFRNITLIIMRRDGMTWHGNRGSLIHYSFTFPSFFIICSQTKQNKIKTYEKKWGGNKTKQKKGGQVRGNQAMNRLSVYMNH